MTPERLSQTAKQLRALPFPSSAEREDLPRRLALVAESLLLDAAPPSSHLVHALGRSTGLTAPVIRWGLQTTLAPLTEDRLRAFMTMYEGPQPSRLLTLWLSSNVFTASVRPIFAALLCGVPILARLSSRESALATAIEAALSPSDQARLKTVLFDHRSDAHMQAALEHCETLEVYGSDETIARLGSEHDDERCRLIPRGHGIGIALIGKNADETDYLALAEDIAAYDQRGCLSPRVALVECGVDDDSENGVHTDLNRHARALTEAMARVERSLPRGSLPSSIASEQSQWRSLGASIGTLHESPSFALVLDHAATLPIGPTHRNLLVRPFAGAAQLVELLKPWTRHLKVVGMAGFEDTSTWINIVQHVSPSARCCELGDMQRPRFEDPADGLPPAAGLSAAQHD